MEDTPLCVTSALSPTLTTGSELTSPWDSDKFKDAMFGVMLVWSSGVCTTNRFCNHGFN